MATWDDVRRIVGDLPDVDEHTTRGPAFWRVHGKGFVWERPLGDKDVEDLGGDAPDGPILGARVEDLVAKEALIADDPDVFFTIPHFDGYPAVLVKLDAVSLEILEEVIVEAWLDRAPKRLSREYAEARGLAGTGGEG
jgi:hypothetical protein